MNRSTFQLWKPFTLVNDQDIKKVKTVNLNFGPQHPAAHGVLRLVLQLNGEIIENTDPHIGLLHRGSEKLMEDRTYLQSMPYFDRFDYVSMMAQEHAYCLGIESLMGSTNYSSTFSQIRTLYDELTRILNHMLAIGCHALDVGSMASIWWAFEEREKIMEFYERVSGARMHAAFYRPNEVNLKAVSPLLLEDITEFIRNCFTTLSEIHNSLTYNKLWKQRLVNIGTYSYKTAIDYGLTGVMSRSVGIKRDLRLSKIETYSNYYYLNFRSFLGQHGDCYDRFLIRMNEMSESLNICTQVLSKIKCGNLKNNNVFNKHELLNYINSNNFFKKNIDNYNSMEEIIKHFKYWSDGFAVTPNWTYQSIESPKGEFGVSLISDGSNKPYRCKVRSPSYQNLQVLPQISKGHFLADLVTLIGTIDIVFGEVDR
jgi:NADH dehydrogenase (ubiquinone) Fe-S protein 2